MYNIPHAGYTISRTLAMPCLGVGDATKTNFIHINGAMLMNKAISQFTYSGFPPIGENDGGLPEYLASAHCLGAIGSDKSPPPPPRSKQGAKPMNKLVTKIVTKFIFASALLLAITITPTVSANADLLSLTIADNEGMAVDLNQTFAAATEGYTANVDNDVTSITVTPTTADTAASVTVDDTTVVSGDASNPITLIVGENAIVIIVTAEDGVATKTYTVTVTRAGNTAPVIAIENAAVDYAENGDTAVATYAATDTESNTITWGLTGTDAGLFTINPTSGLLTFNSSPDYETKSTYAVTVQATETDGDPSNLTGELAVTITVSNVEEEGVIGPITGAVQVGRELTAGEVTDPDGSVVVTGHAWQDAADNSAISGATDAATYTLVATDAGKTIQVMVTYTDGHAAGKTITSAATGTVVAATAPAPPSLTLALDTGSSQTDGITQNGQVNVTLAGDFDAARGDTWKYSTNSGGDFTEVTDSTVTSFTLDDGDYAAGTVQVVQTLLNLDSAAASLGAVTVDNTAPEIEVNTDPATITLTLGDAYIERATVTDNLDASVAIITTGELVNPNTAGRYRLVYTATDVAGNAARKVRLVLVQPVLAFAAGAAPALSSNGTTVDGVTHAKADDILSLTFSVNLALANSPSVSIAGQSVTAVKGTGNSYTATYTVVAADVAGSDGVPAVYDIDAMTAANNPANTLDPDAVTSAIQIDVTAPTASFGPIATGVVGTSQTVRLTFSEVVFGLAESDFGVSFVGVTVTEVTDTGDQTTYSVTFAPPVQSFHVILIPDTVTDAAGNLGPGRTTSEEGSATPNQLPVADAGADQNAHPGTRVTLNGSAQVPHVDVRVTYAWAHTMTDGAPPATPITLTGATASSPTFIAPAIVGTTLVFELTVTDDANPPATDTDTVTITVALDTTAPVLTFVRADTRGGMPGNGLVLVNAGDTITVTLQSSERLDPASVRGAAVFKYINVIAGNRNDTTPATDLVPTGYFSEYAVTYTVRPDDGFSLALRLIVSGVMDAAGNAAETEVPLPLIMIDTVPPTLTLDGPASLSVTRGDDYPDQGVTLGTSGSTLVTVITDADGVVVAAVDTSMLGTYTYTYTATGPAGNIATVTRSVTVIVPDTTAPTVDWGTIAVGVVGTAQEHDITFSEAVTGLAVDDFAADAAPCIAQPCIAPSPTVDIAPSATVTSVTDSGDQTTYTITFTPTATPFRLVLAANSVIDRAGNTGPAATTRAGGTAKTPPLAPTHLVATADTMAVQLTWEAPSSAGDSAITGYEYRQAAEGSASDYAAATWTATTGSSSHTVTGLTSGGTYYFQVRALSALGAGASAEASATLPDTVAPEIRLLGANPVEVHQGSTFTDPGATATDDVDADLSASIMVGGDTVDTDTLGDYTITYDVSDAAGNAAETVTRLVRVVVARDLARLNEVILPEVARSMADQHVSGIVQRLEQARRANIAGTAASSSFGGAGNLTDIVKAQGRALVYDQFDWKRVLAGSAFVLPLNGAGAAASGSGSASGSASASESQSQGITLWGAGDYRSLEATDGVDWDGDLFSLQLGLDTQLNARTILGVAISKSQARLDYTDPSLAVSGDYDLDMTSVHPYLGWATGGLDFWATAGYGEGELEISEDRASGEAIPSSDLSVRTYALGASGILMETGLTTLHLKGEAMSSTVELDGNEQITAVTRDASRLRMTLEATRAQALDSGAQFESSLEAGLRYDGGDGETGAGAEVGASLRYASLGGGLVIEGKARALVGGKGEAKEWGLSGLVKFASSTAGRGLSFSLTPGYGVTNSGVQQLWQQGLIDEGSAGYSHGASSEYSPSLEVRLDYGMHALRGPGLMTPYTELSLGDKNTYRLGLQWQHSKLFDLKFVTERKEGTTTADHRIYLEGELAF